MLLPALLNTQSKQREIILHRVVRVELAQVGGELEGHLPVGLFAFEDFELAGYALYMYIAGTNQLGRL